MVCVAIGFFIGNNLFVEDNSEWQEQYDLGLKYLNEGRYEEAIIAFSAAITIDPYQTSPYMRRVECYAAVGGEENYRKAIQDCETILSLDDTLTSVWLGAAELIEVLDGPEAALDFLRPGLDATENASSITDRIKELEDKSPAIQETETALSEEVVEEEPQSVVQETTVSNADPGMAAYLGATTNYLIENYGLNYYTDYWEGGKFIKFDSVDAMFFYDQTTNKVFNIVCGGSETVTQGLTADMTYTELRAAAGSMGITLDPPESYYNQMDDRNEYFVRFKIGELSIDYTWLDTPFENAPYEVTLMGTAPQVASADVPNEVAEAETIRFADIPSDTNS